MFVLNYPCPKAVLFPRNKYIIRKTYTNSKLKYFPLQTMPAPETHYKQLRLSFLSPGTRMFLYQRQPIVRKHLLIFLNAHHLVLKMWWSITPKPHSKQGLKEKETNNHFVKMSTFSSVAGKRSTSYYEYLLYKLLQGELFIQRDSKPMFHKDSLL